METDTNTFQSNDSLTNFHGSIASFQKLTHDRALALLPHSSQKQIGHSPSVLLPVFLALATFSFVFANEASETERVRFAAEQQVQELETMYAAAPDEPETLPEQEIIFPEASSSSEVSSSAESIGVQEVVVPIEPPQDDTSISSTEENVDAQIAPDEFQILPLPEPPDLPDVLPEASHVYGVYLTATSAGSEEMLSDTSDDLLGAQGNALVIDVKGSAVFFDADAPMARELGLVKKRYDLPEILGRAHARGIYVIGRFVALKDAGLASVRRDTIIADPVSGRTIGYEFVDPENPLVLAYNADVLCALAGSGIDEINLDYIRFSTEQVGELRVFSPEEKARKVGVFVQMARDVLRSCGSSTKLGISTYAILGWNYPVNLATLGQDVVAWAPLVDVISPMAYPSTFAEGAYYNPALHKGSRNRYLVWRTLEGYKALLGDQAWKLRPWIQGYGMTLKGMTDQMKAVSDAGLCGFTVWSAENIYGNTFSAMKNWKRGEGC